MRIPQIEAQWGGAAQYLRIIRDAHETADSMRRKHFEFVSRGHLLAADEARSVFSDAVGEHAPLPSGDPVRYRQACGGAYCRSRNYRSADIADAFLKAVQS